MDLVTFSFRSPLLILMNQSVAIRAAFLIADETAVGGDLYQGIVIDKMLEPSTPQKAAQAMLIFEVNPVAIRALNETIACMKDYKTLKNKTTQVITALKRMEKSVMQAWQSCKERIIATYAQSGLPELKKVMEGESLTLLGACSSAEVHQSGCYPCSKILLLETQVENPNVEKSYFMLPAEYKQMHTDSRFDFHNWNEINLTFCNINKLTGAELVAVRQQLRPAAKPFCEAIDKWSAMLPTMTPEQSYGWYQQFIKPAAAALQQAIDANELLNTVNRLTNDDAKVRIHIGEAPTQALWLFFDMHQSIHEATKKVLEKPEAVSFGAKRKPYFAVSYENWQNVHNHKPDAEQEITAVKKSIVFE